MCFCFFFLHIVKSYTSELVTYTFIFTTFGRYEKMCVVVKHMCTHKFCGLLKGLFITNSSQ